MTDITQGVCMQKMIKNFIEMAEILSPSKKEKELSNYLIKKLKIFSEKIIVDRASNLIIKIPGDKRLNPFLLSAHMDTVQTSKRPSIKINKKGIFTSNKTILGADCKAGISIIIELVEKLFKENIKHPPLELVFTAGEEIGLYGSSRLDKSLVGSEYGVVLDNEKKINQVVTEAVGVDNFEILIKGKASHSGVEPEKGISAIKILSSIINQIKTGRLSDYTTLNIGFIEGGKGINIVPPQAKAKGEIRSFKREEINLIEDNIEKIIIKSIKKEKKINGLPSYEFKINKRFAGFSIDKNSYIIKTIEKAYKKNNIKAVFTKSFGGTDANNFYKMGIITPNIATGMKNVHTPDEYLDISEFNKSFDIIVDIIRLLSEDKSEDKN